MKRTVNESKLNFAALAKVMEKIDDNGRFGRCGNWSMGLGGYDMGYEIYYRNEPVGRVDYGDREYELYDNEFLTPEQLPEFLKAIDARGFRDLNPPETDDIGDEDLLDSDAMLNESTRKTKMKFRKIVKEADEQGGSGSDAPAVYVGTYGKYADGSLKGQWVKLTDFDTYDEFMDHIRELHKDEKDPEFMFQDYENFPERWYSESGMSEETFDKIIEWYMMEDNQKNAYEAYLDAGLGDNIQDFEDAYQGHYNSEVDFAEHLIDDVGMPDDIDYYFDYEAFGRDLMYDYHTGDEGEEDAEGNPQDPDHYYDMDNYDMGEYESDRQVGEDYVDNLGGVDQLGEQTISNYFDYEAFARDLFMNDYTYEGGYVFSSY